MNWFAFIGAAALGGLVRFVVESKLPPIGKSAFPKATLFVNIAGAFLLGLVFAAPENIYTTIGIAFCGALTTFSAISAQLLNRVLSGAFVAAINYLLATLALGLIAAQLGLLLGDLIF
jgi:CrcB protein